MDVVVTDVFNPLCPTVAKLALPRVQNIDNAESQQRRSVKFLIKANNQTNISQQKSQGPGEYGAMLFQVLKLNWHPRLLYQTKPTFKMKEEIDPPMSVKQFSTTKPVLEC